MPVAKAGFDLTDKYCFKMSAGRCGDGHDYHRGDDGEVQKQEIELEKKVAATALGSQELGATGAGGALDAQEIVLDLEEAAVEALRCEEFEADEFSFLNDEDMQLFGLNPLIDPLNLVSCNVCRKPIIESQFLAHYERCTSALDPEQPTLVHAASHHENIETEKGKQKSRRTLPVTRSQERDQKHGDETDSENDPKGMLGLKSKKSSAPHDHRRKAKVEGHSSSIQEKISAENRDPGDLTSPQLKRKSTRGCIATAVPMESSQARGPSLRKRDSQTGHEAPRLGLRKQKRDSDAEARSPGLRSRKRKGDSQAEDRRAGLRERKQDGSAVCSRFVKRSKIPTYGNLILSRKRKVTVVSSNRPKRPVEGRAPRPHQSHKKSDETKGGEEVSLRKVTSGPKRGTSARARRGNRKQETKAGSEQGELIASAGALVRKQEKGFEERRSDARALRRQRRARAKDQASMKNSRKKQSFKNDTSDKLKSSGSMKSASCDDPSGHGAHLETSSMMKDERKIFYSQYQNDHDTTESDSDAYA